MLLGIHSSEMRNVGIQDSNGGPNEILSFGVMTYLDAPKRAQVSFEVPICLDASSLAICLIMLMMGM